MMHLPIAGIVSGGQSAPLPNYNRVIFDYSFPVGIPGAYTPTKADTIVCPPAVTLSAGADVILSADGNAHSTVNGRLIYNINNVPAKSTSIRKYEMWGTTNGEFLAEGGAGFLFNYVDVDNFWECRFLAFAGTNGYRLTIGEMVAGGFTFRGSPLDLASVVRTPLLWHCTLYDLGDRITYALEGFETDTTTDIREDTNTYSVGGRAGQAVTRTFVIDRTITVTPGHIITRGFRITDI